MAEATLMASGDDRGGERPGSTAPAFTGMALGDAADRPPGAQTPASSIIAGLQQGQHPFMTANTRQEVRLLTRPAPCPRTAEKFQTRHAPTVMA